jgi:hypothetical protein
VRFSFYAEDGRLVAVVTSGNANGCWAQSTSFAVPTCGAVVTGSYCGLDAGDGEAAGDARTE